jgi:hypothetical protein
MEGTRDSGEETVYAVKLIAGGDCQSTAEAILLLEKRSVLCFQK